VTVLAEASVTSGHPASPDVPAGQRAVAAANIRRLRLARAWSQQHLAKLMGIRDGSVVSRIETSSSSRRLTADDLDKLAAAFGVTVKELLTGCQTCGGNPQPGFACLACGARNDSDRRGNVAASQPAPRRQEGTVHRLQARWRRAGNFYLVPRELFAAVRAWAAREIVADSPGPATARPASAVSTLPLVAPEMIGRTGSPQWAPVARAVAAEITAGRHEAGMLMPALAVAAAHGVTREVAARALRELCALGYAERRGNRFQVADGAPWTGHLG
jgi:transcriptional regulator with XRE-family HTH domain